MTDEQTGLIGREFRRVWSVQLVDFLKFTLAARLPPPPHCVSTGLRLKIALMNRLF